MGIRQTEETPVVSTAAGTPMSPDWLRKMFQAFCAEHGFDATFYTLRHSAATWLLHSGADVVTVARRLGHADPGLVLRVYGHATKDSDRDAAERMQEALGERNKRDGGPATSSEKEGEEGHEVLRGEQQRTSRGPT